MNKIYWLVCFCCLLFCADLKAQVFEVDTLQYQGTSKNIVNLVIMGDGYTQNQLGQFTLDAKKFREYLFSQSPYSHYRDYFNVFIIKVISKESGVKHSHIAADCPSDTVQDHTYGTKKAVPVSDPDNYFGSSFDNNGLHRLVVSHNSKAIAAVLKANFPNYNQAIILANSPYYGGSGGQIPTATVNVSSNAIAIHELGHSFALLADEYWPGLQFVADGPNRSHFSAADQVPWKNWIGINGTGVYSYGGKAPQSVWYRPHEYCKMQYLVAPFCSVCSETIIEKIYSLTNPVIKAFPDPALPVVLTQEIKAFKVHLAKPDPNTLKVEWFLNGEQIAAAIDSIRINPGLFSAGRNTVSVSVMDTTEMVRMAPHSDHKYEISWVVENDQVKMLMPPEVRWGDSIQACYGNGTVLSVKNPQAGFVYNWYKDSSGGKPQASGINFITAPVFKETVFYLEALWKGKKTNRTPVSVKVLAEISVPEQVLMEQQGDTIRISIPGKRDDIEYRWYESESAVQPISGYYNPTSRNLNPQNEGTLFKVPANTVDVSYYVEAVSKTTTCFSKRKRVVVKGVKG